ncbi:MAG: hypothetical protein ACE5KU_00790 [Nitrososphaerales archaeon]
MSNEVEAGLLRLQEQITLNSIDSSLEPTNLFPTIYILSPLYYGDRHRYTHRYGYNTKYTDGHTDCDEDGQKAVIVRRVE